MGLVHEKVWENKNTAKLRASVRILSWIAALAVVAPGSAQARPMKHKQSELKSLAATRKDTVRKLGHQIPVMAFAGEITLRTVTTPHGPGAIDSRPNIRFQTIPDPDILARSPSANFNDLEKGLASGRLVIGMSREETTPPPQPSTSEKTFTRECGTPSDIPNITLYPTGSTPATETKVVSILPEPASTRSTAFGGAALAPVIFPPDGTGGIQYGLAENPVNGLLYQGTADSTFDCGLPIANTDLMY